MINWLIKKIANAIWHPEFQMTTLIKETVINETRRIIENAFRYKSCLKHPDSSSYLSDDGMQIGRTLNEVTQYHFDTHTRDAVVDFIKSQTKFLDEEKFIDSIVERINKKQVG
jgi:hypothetical protein